MLTLILKLTDRLQVLPFASKGHLFHYSLENGDNVAIKCLSFSVLFPTSSLSVSILRSIISDE